MDFVYLIEVISKFWFVYHFTALFTRDDSFFILCQEKQGESQFMAFLSPLFIAGHSPMNGKRAFENVIAFIELYVRAASQICFICIYK